MENIVIIWLGWAGYTAGIYAWRYNMKPLLIWMMDWGTITESHIVENFPWYPDATSGFDIMDNMKKQAENYWARVMNDTVKSIELIDNNDPKKWYIVHTTMNWDIQTKTLMLWLWTKKSRLWLPWEKEFAHKWVSYCATCDGFFYKWKTTVVIGWWNSAFIEALYLSDICEKVYLIHRRNEFRWEPIWLDKIKEKENIEIITPAVVKSIWWENKVNHVNISIAKETDVYSEDNTIEKKLDVDGVFIAIWSKPNVIEGLDLETDKGLYITVWEHMQTSLPWVYAAWDCTTWSAKFQQLITACSEWAIAVEWIFKYLNEN